MIETKFTAIPTPLMRRPDILPTLKLILGRLFTLSNYRQVKAEVSASGLADQTGLSSDTAERAVKVLEKAGALVFKERRRHGGEYPCIVYSIDRPKLLAFMEPPATAGSGRASPTDECDYPPEADEATAGSGRHHPQAADEATARSGLKEVYKEDTIKNPVKKEQADMEAQTEWNMAAYQRELDKLSDRRLKRLVVEEVKKSLRTIRENGLADFWPPFEYFLKPAKYRLQMSRR